MIEKLVELMAKAYEHRDEICDGHGCERCAYEPYDECGIQIMAEYLIANGVTVQEWISVKDRLPENDHWALCFMKDKSFGTFRVFQWNYIDWQWNDGSEWYDENDVTHWMPLPEPPKGE
jgi:hypothetical protein